MNKLAFYQGYVDGLEKLAIITPDPRLASRNTQMIQQLQEQGYKKRPWYSNALEGAGMLMGAGVFNPIAAIQQGSVGEGFKRGFIPGMVGDIKSGIDASGDSPVTQGMLEGQARSHGYEKQAPAAALPSYMQKAPAQKQASENPLRTHLSRFIKK